MSNSWALITLLIASSCISGIIGSVTILEEKSESAGEGVNSVKENILDPLETLSSNSLPNSRSSKSLKSLNDGDIDTKLNATTTTTTGAKHNSQDEAKASLTSVLLGRRDPKLGFNLPIAIPGLTSPTSTPYPNGNYQGTNYGDYNTGTTGGFGDATGGLGIASTAVLVKSGLLGGLTAIKAAILPPLFIGSIILFLIAGAVFFTCNVINCGFGTGFGSGSGSGGGFGSGFGGFPSLTNLFNRNGYDYYENQVQQMQPVYSAIDEGYKKFN